eukprot:m.115778 g.115778  ORF g.115778 m.115778 type:complete len:190 (+) comp13580_c0_seq2:286-855(+)
MHTALLFRAIPTQTALQIKAVAMGGVASAKSLVSMTMISVLTESNSIIFINPSTVEQGVMRVHQNQVARIIFVAKSKNQQFNCAKTTWIRPLRAVGGCVLFIGMTQVHSVTEFHAGLHTLRVSLRGLPMAFGVWVHGAHGVNLMINASKRGLGSRFLIHFSQHQVSLSVPPHVVARAALLRPRFHRREH